MFRWSRALTLFLATSLIVAACGSPDAQEANGDEPAATVTAVPAEVVPATAWEEVLSHIDKGVVDMQTAINAFSLAFRPITGAETSDLESGFEGSGSGPLRWLLGHWDELSDEQQNEVNQILADWTGPSIEAMGQISGLTAYYAVQPHKALVDDLVVNLETLLGRSLTLTVTTKLTTSEAAVDKAYAVAIQQGAGGVVTGDALTCTIIFGPKSVGLGGAELTSLAAHELFHCFEGDLGSMEQSNKRPPWIVEGLAEWVGETLSGGSSLSGWTWGRWLKTQSAASLFNRAYDAIGFYAHVNDSGVDLWPRVDLGIAASDTSSEAAYQAFIEPSSLELIDSWAAGYYRDAGAAPLWDQNGPGITADKPTLDTSPLISNSTFALATGPYAAFVNDVNVSAEVVTFDSPGTGLAQLTGGQSQRLADLHGRVFCTIGTCSCPEGSNNAGTIFEQMEAGVIRVAATGHTTGSDVTLLGWSLENYCNDERCHVGQWESVAWHVPRVIIGGWGIPMWIDSEGEGYIDFSQAAPLLGVAQAGTFDTVYLAPVKVELAGKSRFTVEAAGPVVNIVAATGDMFMTPFIDLGDGWMETGSTSFYGVGQLTTTASVLCAGNTLTINGAIEFTRISEDGDLPADADTLTPTTGLGGDDGTPITIGTLPAIDPCQLLTLEELQQIFPNATQPPAAEGFGGQLIQCSYGPMAVQLQPSQPPGLYGQGGEAYGFSLIDIPGVGDWAVTQMQSANPDFGIQESVLTVAGGNSNGTVILVALETVVQNGPAHLGMIELLELALSRL